MIRLLVIGRSAAAWGEKLLALAPDITVDMARLPAAGIRQLSKTPPDAIFIVEASNPNRANALLEAIRKQPLGELTPVVVHGDGIDPTLDVQAVLASSEGASEILRALEESLELEIGELTAGSAEVVTMETSRAPTAENKAVPPEAYRPVDDDANPARLETPKFILEEIVDEEPDGPRHIERGDIFGARTHPRAESDVDDAIVKRMLRSVRHEDYYAILGVHRGAETQAIRDAYYRQLKRYDPQRVDLNVAHRFHVELAEIRDALEDAWAVLGDANLRTDYLDATTRT